MRFSGSLSYLLRNIGLEILAFVLIRLWFGLSPEPAKLVVKKSFWIASSRCWIHLLPLTVSLVLIWLNLKGFYIAQTFSQYSIGDLTDQSNSVTLALIQIAAKVQVCCSADPLSAASSADKTSRNFSSLRVSLQWSFKPSGMHYCTTGFP